MENAVDTFSWNASPSIERQAIRRFLCIAEQRLYAVPEVVPIDAAHVRAVVKWLRGLLDKRPSEVSVP